MLGCVVWWVIVIDVLVVSIFIGLVCNVVCCFTVIVVLWVCFGLLFGVDCLMVWLVVFGVDCLWLGVLMVGGLLFDWLDWLFWFEV